MTRSKRITNGGIRGICWSRPRLAQARQDLERGGIKVSDAEMASFSIQPANFHGEWNYTITPRQPDR